MLLKFEADATSLRPRPRPTPEVKRLRPKLWPRGFNISGLET